MRRMGIFLGSFDPPLTCHVEAADRVMRKYSLDEVLFVPLIKGRGAGKGDAGYADRICMCIAAVLGRPGMNVISRDIPSGLLPVIKRLRKTCSDAKLFCMMDIGLFGGIIEKLSGKAAYRDISFLCFAQKNVDPQIIARLALSAGLDLEILPFPSSAAAEAEARHTVFSLNDPPSMQPGVVKICALKGFYIQEHTQDVKGSMGEHRWQHTLGVRRTAVALAEKYGGSMVKCAAAAFYHDCAKDMSPKDMRRILLTHGTDASDEVLQSGAMMHGPVGAILAEEKYHVYDREVLDAIRYHTTGREEMTLTDLVIFVADAIEPNREDYPGLSGIRFLSGIDLNAAALYSLYATREYVLSRGKYFHLAGQRTILALEDRLKREPLRDARAMALLREKADAFDQNI